MRAPVKWRGALPP
ncbi:hypothetical protein EC93001_0103, partial [Escherichia coli 93-001]